MLRSAVVNQWNYRTVNLSSVAGKTISDIRLDADGTTQPGQWDIYYQDIVFTGADGSVWPLFSQNSVAPGMSGFGTPGITQMSETIHDCSGSGCAPINTTTYFHDDQIGSARLLSEGYGYPVWQGTFTPFGQDASPELTSNHYKFNGKERGEASEGGLDNFGARSYSSVIGRWMTPDWSDSPSPVPYAKLTDPQSLNLYSFVTDDPLSHTDLDGHFQSAPCNVACPNNNGDDCKPYTPPSCPSGTSGCTSSSSVSINLVEGTSIIVTKTTSVSITNSDGTVTTTSSTLTATFSMKEANAGQFLGATAQTSTNTIDPKNNNWDYCACNDKKGPVQAVSFGDAAQAFRPMGITLGAIQSSAHPDALTLFPRVAGKDIHDHPLKYAGYALSAAGLPIGAVSIIGGAIVSGLGVGAAIADDAMHP